jgi:hypothetical protein
MPHRHKKKSKKSKKAKKAKKQEMSAGKGLAFGLPAKGPGSETNKTPVEVEREPSVVTEVSGAADESDLFESSNDVSDLDHAELGKSSLPYESRWPSRLSLDSGGGA